MNAPLYSIEAEQSLIGACLLENRLIDRMAETVGPADFSQIEHQIIWGAMNRLAGSGQYVDVITLSEALSDKGSLEDVGGLAYLVEVSRNTPSASNASGYARIVTDLSHRRRLLDELGSIDQLARDKQTPFSEVIDGAQGRIAKLIRADAQGIGPVGDYLATDLLDEIDRKWSGDVDPMGASFGLPDLDRKTMGMHAGQLIVVGARSSMGKTAFALNTIRTACIEQNRPTVMFSMEMDRKTLITRLTAAIGQVPINAIRDPKQYMTEDYFARLTNPVHVLKTAPLVIDDRAALTPSQVRGACKRWRAHYGDLGLVVVDYLGLMRPDRKHGTREQEVAEASGAMKALAKELQCPVLLLSQLNRSLEQRPNKRPVMSDLRESGAIEQDADIILFLYRNEVYHPDDERTQGVAEIIIGKQREGELGTVYAAARLALARMDPLDAEKIRELRSPPAEESRRKPKSAMEMM